MIDIHCSYTISIHALTKRATITCLSLITTNTYFNPRSHEESDKSHTIRLKIKRNFNPRSHEESDANSKKM